MPNIKIPPKIELPISFKIVLIGKIKILPNINKKMIHAKYVIIVFVSKFHHLSLFCLLHVYDKTGTNITMQNKNLIQFLKSCLTLILWSLLFLLNSLV